MLVLVLVLASMFVLLMVIVVVVVVMAVVVMPSYIFLSLFSFFPFAILPIFSFALFRIEINIFATQEVPQCCHRHTAFPARVNKEGSGGKDEW